MWRLGTRNCENNKYFYIYKNTNTKEEIKDWMYILLCADGSYYTGSTNDLDRSIIQHHSVEGDDHTKKRFPVRLIYFEEYERIDLAFYRDKQGRKQKEDQKGYSTIASTGRGI